MILDTLPGLWVTAWSYGAQIYVTGRDTFGQLSFLAWERTSVIGYFGIDIKFSEHFPHFSVLKGDVVLLLMLES